MTGRGLQDIPIRPPQEWSAAWYLKHIREVLALVDIRNAIEGPGITITGNSSEPATISADGAIVDLLNVPFVTLSLSAQLTAERVLAGESGVVEITDGGAGTTVTVGLEVFGVPYNKLVQGPPFSVLGNQLTATGPISPITAAFEGDVLWVRDIDGAGTLGLEFTYLRFLDGSPSSPGIAFYDDQDTGLYRIGDNNFGMATDGALRWDIDTTRVRQNIPLVVAHGVGGVSVLNDLKPTTGIFITSEAADPARGSRSTIEFREHGAPDNVAGFKIRLLGDPDPSVTNGDLFFYRNNGSGDTFVMRLMKEATQAQFARGSAGTPPISFSTGTTGSAENTGIYQSATNAINISTDGVDRWGVNTAAIVFSLPQYGEDGDDGAPTYSFTSDTDTGLFLLSAGKLAVTTAGVIRLTISPTEIISTLSIQIPSGLSSAPSLAFSADPDTGLYGADPDVLAIVTGGSERFRIAENGEIGLTGAQYGDAGQVLTSNGTGAAPTWEDSAGGGGGGSLVYANTTIPGGNTIANTATETAFTSSYNIPANSLQVGSVIRARLFGVYSTDASVAPTLRVRLKLDSTTVVDTQAATLSTGVTSAGWSLEAQLIVTAIGGSGSVESQGVAALDAALVDTPNTSGISVDTTVAQTVSATAQWGAADTDNTITLRELVIWIEDQVAPDAAASAEATYLTEADETATLPNSRQLLAGSGITFDDSVAGERTISSSGGGGGGWTSIFNYSGSSLADFTTDSGTWAVTGGVFELTTSGGSFGRLRKTARIPQSGLIIETEIMVASTSRNVSISTAGIIMGWDGTGNGGCTVRIQWANRNPAANGEVFIEVDGVASVAGPIAQTFALDTWVTLRVQKFGAVVDVYFNGAYVLSGNFSDQNIDEDCSFVGLNGFDADDIFYRNFQAWRLTQP